MEKLLTEPDLMNLPWATLVTLACGYMGYFIAHVGIRGHHKQIDVAFCALVYGLIAAFGYQAARSLGDGMLLSTIYGAVVACTSGALWRVWGRRILRWLLRAGDIAHTLDTPSAWLSLFDEKNVRATQLSVTLKDGTILLCEDLSRFANKPNGPFVFGSTGDILMYVTDEKSGDSDWELQSDVEYGDWGAVVTHIPASEISRVRFRRI